MILRVLAEADFIGTCGDVDRFQMSKFFTKLHRSDLVTLSMGMKNNE